jgi:hypothetical protein
MKTKKIRDGYFLTTILNKLLEKSDSRIANISLLLNSFQKLQAEGVLTVTDLGIVQQTGRLVQQNLFVSSILLDPSLLRGLWKNKAYLLRPKTNPIKTLKACYNSLGRLTNDLAKTMGTTTDKENLLLKNNLQKFCDLLPKDVRHGVPVFLLLDLLSCTQELLRVIKNELIKTQFTQHRINLSSFPEI